MFPLWNGRRQDIDEENAKQYVMAEGEFIMKKQGILAQAKKLW